MYPRTLGLVLFAMLVSGCFVSSPYGSQGGYYGYGGHGRHRYRYRPVYTYQTAPAYQAPPTYTVPAPSASAYASGQAIVVAPGQNLVLPTANLAVNAIQYVVITAEDGRQMTLSAAEIQAAGAGQLSIAVPTGVTRGTVSVYSYDGQQVTLPFQVQVSVDPNNGGYTGGYVGY
jgi:hypothetical protein